MLPPKRLSMTRRSFIRSCGLLAAGLILAGCSDEDKSNLYPASGEEVMMEMKRGVNKNGWRIFGPGGGGAQYIPTIKPDDPDTALVACDMTGVYITHN
ncbi:MAG: hypothetical protein HGA53_05240, partial [Anaerolineaceae bacterium]|nr:hypothetical protein [Anaerolineaceae bacterium]